MTKTDFRATLEDLLDLPRGSLRDEDTRDTVERWSSLADVQIMVLLESELAIADPEVLAYDSVGDLMRALETRGAFPA